MASPMAQILALWLLIHAHIRGYKGLRTNVCGAEHTTYCAFLNHMVGKERDGDGVVIKAPQDVDSLDSMQSGGMVMPDNSSMQCPESKNFCFTLFLVNQTDKAHVTVLKQGCWDHPDREQCANPRCEANYIPKNKMLKNNTRFCCCLGDMCNVNVTDTYVPGEEKYSPPGTTYGIRDGDLNYREKTIIIALASVSAVAVLVILVYLAIRLIRDSGKLPPDPLYLDDPPSTPNFEMDQLKLQSLISRGRFGEVWKSSLNDMDVAVKVYNLGQRQYYLNEKDVYMLAHMDHDALLHYYGSDERLTVDGVNQFLLVMTYMPMGTLTNYLKNNIVDWATMCRMCHSMASGLAHLHSDIIKGDKVKPAVAHRDFNSRNVLVREDLSCVLCDYGFAMKISGPCFYRNGQEENAEQSSLSDVGTLRYMAPEVLEGAVNLRDCEASLKQIDVYALGLMLWEVASRCSDLYQGMPVPVYQLPFQPMIGMHPTFEQMQTLVSRKKERPAFPDVWKDTNQAIRALKDTMDDCWDHDAEARLTAMCVEERILDMMNLWDNRHKGLTPPIMNGYLDDLQDKGLIQRNATTSSHPHMSDSAASAAAGEGSAGPYQMGSDGAGFSEASASLGEPPQSGSGRPHRFSYNENSVSTSTVETTISPTDPGEVSVGTPSVTNMVPTKANCNMIYARTSRAIQPHQGQNPTVERNTHKCSDEELAVLGNSLVSKAQAAAAKAQNDKKKSELRMDTRDLTDEVLDAIADNLGSSLVQNDMLSQHQQHQNRSLQDVQSGPTPTARPLIPYLQNEVHLSEPLVVRPKQPNVPGNGFQNYSSGKGKSSWIGWLKKSKGQSTSASSKHPKSAANKGRFGFSLFGNKKAVGTCNGVLHTADAVSENTPLRNGINHVPTLSLSHVGAHPTVPNYQERKSNLDVTPTPVPTEVCIMNGTAIVRPTSLPIGGQSDMSSPNQGHPANYINDERDVRVQGLTNKSHSSVNLSPTTSPPVGCRVASSGLNRTHSTHSMSNSTSESMSERDHAVPSPAQYSHSNHIKHKVLVDPTELCKTRTPTDGINNNNNDNAARQAGSGGRAVSPQDRHSWCGSGVKAPQHDITRATGLKINNISNNNASVERGHEDQDLSSISMKHFNSSLDANTEIQTAQDFTC